jgi:hypothetical protein
MENNPTAKATQRKETGFVGVFDILGYQSFLESGISEVTFRVVNTLVELPQQIEEVRKNFMGKSIEELGDSDLAWALRQIEPLVVSDSILLRSSYDEDHVRNQPLQAAAFVMWACIFERYMFEQGLPVRGAIAFGDFIFVQHVFAGKPIIDAYNLGQSLNLAACAIHETAKDEFQRLHTLSPGTGFLTSPHLVPYLTPVKKVEEELNLLCLNWAWPPRLKGYLSLKEIVDLRQYVHEKFCAHNKQMRLDVIPKAENTERYFRFLRANSLE